MVLNALFAALLGAVLIVLVLGLARLGRPRVESAARRTGPLSVTRNARAARRAVMALLLPLLPFAATAAATPPPSGAAAAGEVVLPLGEYLALVDRAEAATRARVARDAAAPAVAELVSQHTALRLDDRELAVVGDYEVLVQGLPRAPVRLPFPGFAGTVEVRRDGAPAPGAAVTAAGPGGGLLLVAPSAGRYHVVARGRAPVASAGGIARVTVPPPAAPIATLALDLPAEVVWTAPGAVLVAERVEGERRLLRLSPRRGTGGESGGEQVIELRRRFDDDDAERLLGRAVVLTLLELREEGPRRHDVVLYEVSRGGLASFVVDLPPGLVVGGAASDEGTAVPVVEGQRLTVHRQRQLQSTGYLLLTSTPQAAAALPLAAPLPLATPGLEVRAHYLAVASTLAAEARPEPAEAWSRVDLDDLPELLGEALQAVDLVAAWRLLAESATTQLAVERLPTAPRLAATVQRRDSTTLLTVDGTLVHRDRFTVAAATSAASGALELTLPPGAVLWSARVGDQPVRPLRRDDGGGAVLVPLGFTAAAETVVEVVAVQERALPPGRSLLALELPATTVPVLDHRWRLLLPQRARYRFRDGALRPASEPAVAGRPVSVLGIINHTPQASLPGSYDFDAFAESAISQGPGGDAAVFGRVVDRNGAALPGVNVTLTGPSLAQPVQQVTDTRGAFRIAALPAGTYHLVAELAGFASVDYPNVQANSGRRTVLAVTLGEGSVEEMITVTAESPLLDERRISTGALVSPAERTGEGWEIGKRRREESPAANELAANTLYELNVGELRQGLVGGVKPLPVEIPESGKALLLTGVLPPSRVTVELEVRAAR